MATNEALDMVGQALRAGNCGKAISRMENYLAAWPEAQTAGKLAELREDYALMENYWRRGAQDPQREEMYGRLLQRMYVLWANVAHHERMKVSPYQHSLYTRVRQAGIRSSKAGRSVSCTTSRKRSEALSFSLFTAQAVS